VQQVEANKQSRHREPGFELPPERLQESFLRTEVRWNNGVVELWSAVKYQIPSTKLQTNLKFQYSMTKTGL
jgi:hypothetical protein